MRAAWRARDCTIFWRLQRGLRPGGTTSTLLPLGPRDRGPIRVRVWESHTLPPSLPAAVPPLQEERISHDEVIES